MNLYSMNSLWLVAVEFLHRRPIMVEQNIYQCRNVNSTGETEEMKRRDLGGGNEVRGETLAQSSSRQILFRKYTER